MLVWFDDSKWVLILTEECTGLYVGNGEQRKQLHSVASESDQLQHWSIAEKDYIEWRMNDERNRIMKWDLWSKIKKFHRNLKSKVVTLTNHSYNFFYSLNCKSSLEYLNRWSPIHVLASLSSVIAVTGVTNCNKTVFTVDMSLSGCLKVLDIIFFHLPFSFKIYESITQGVMSSSEFEFCFEYWISTFPFG